MNVNGAGGPIPATGSKLDTAIMRTYINPARKTADKDRARIQILGQLDEAIKNDPDLTYGQVKQILINGFTAAGGSPGGRIAVADIHEVLPGMQSTLGRFISELDQGASNKVSPEFRKVVGHTIGPEYERWSKNYQTNGDLLEKNLNLPPAAAKHYRSQIYPEVPAPGPAASDPVREQAQRALNDPSAPPAVKAKAKAYLGL